MRILIMMILSTLMKMLLWTLPGASLHIKDHSNRETVYSRLQNDFDFLKTHLASEKLMPCGGVNVQNLNVFTNQFLRSLSLSQQSAALSSAVALAELLSQIPLDAEDSIKTLLRGFLRVNRVLSEAAYVVPIAALPPSSRADRDETAYLIHVARPKIIDLQKIDKSQLIDQAESDQSQTIDQSKVDQSKSTDQSKIDHADQYRSGSDRSSIRVEEVEVNVSLILEWKFRHKQLKLVQENLNMLNVRKTSEDELSNRLPMAILEKHCQIDEDSVSETDLSPVPKHWRILLGFLTHQTTKIDTLAPVFYVTLPLHSVDLNQCDDSPHPKIRGSHGCVNTTCTFSPGGGFELGHYKCCCQVKNASTNSNPSSSFNWLEQQHQYHQLFMLQKQEQCFDGKWVEDERFHDRPFPGQCVTYFVGDFTLRKVLLAINVVCALASFALIFVVMTQRKVQDWGSRGWALMELFLLGAILLYGIVILEFLQPQTVTCCLIVWCRELGFALFYGAVVLKIHRNLFEHRVRKAHHVYIKEKDLLKYLLCIVAFTVIGLVAWTVTAIQASESNQLNAHGTVTSSIAMLSHGRTKSGNPYVVCVFFHWNVVWHTIECAFLTYGAYLSYKARNTTWNERCQFAGAVIMEMVVSLTMIIVKNNIWLESSPDTLLVLSFIQVHLTITVVIAVIMATKFYYASLDPSVRAHSVVSSGPNKPHPSLAKLRDNLVNGTVDFAEVPIAEMNPEDIRAELKRVYTQLRMYKLTNLYMENPHISKRKGGKKTSSKQTNRRFSIPTVPSKAHNKELKRLEADERSSLAKGTDDDNASVGSATDLTIQSSPHNIYLSRTALAAAKKLQLDSDLSVRI